MAGRVCVPVGYLGLAARNRHIHGTLGHFARRVHELLHDLLWPERPFCMGTLGPKYLIYGCLDPLGWFGLMPVMLQWQSDGERVLAIEYVLCRPCQPSGS